MDTTHEEIGFRARGSPEAGRIQAIFSLYCYKAATYLDFLFAWTQRFFGPCATDCYDGRLARARLNSTSISRLAPFRLAQGQLW